jgi:hypothetical protein
MLSKRVVQTTIEAALAPVFGEQPFRVFTRRNRGRDAVYAYQARVWWREPDRRLAGYALDLCADTFADPTFDDQTLVAILAEQVEILAWTLADYRAGGTAAGHEESPQSD